MSERVLEWAWRLCMWSSIAVMGVVLTLLYSSALDVSEGLGWLVVGQLLLIMSQKFYIILLENKSKKRLRESEKC